MSRSININNTQRWVVKIGSALLTANGQGLNRPAILGWVEQLVALKRAGLEIVLVSSGSVAEGMVRLGWQQRPVALCEQQAAAAIGQMGLVHAYEEDFSKYGLHTAQILLTHDDLANRRRYLNARQTLSTLIGLDVIPIINENDTVATDEIRFGDNDTLAGMVANLIEADLLIILTDQSGFYNADPRTETKAQLIQQADANDKALDNYAQGSGGALGRGGMLTKLSAARLAARSGAHTIIASGNESDVLLRLRDNENLGSLLIAKQQTLTARKQWLAGQQQTHGSLVLDAGAVEVLRSQGKSLLPVGVINVQGEFERGDLLICVDQQGHEIARGLSNYNAQEARNIIGKPSQQIADILGYHGNPELIHRDNLVFVES